MFLAALASCGRAQESPILSAPEVAGGRPVVVYTAVDQEYAEEIFQRFTEATGVRVEAVYDAEATKTTGLVNRVIAERARPIADVYWNNEMAQMLRLKAAGALARHDPPASHGRPGVVRDSDGAWTAFGGRARVIIVNRDRLPASRFPRSIRDILADSWPADRVGMSLPLFGTAASHAAALYAAWGPEAALTYYRGIVKRGVRIVDGNAAARDMVVDGRLDWAIVDNDDAEVAVRKGDPVAVIVPDQEGEGACIIPNAVALVAGAPREAEGRLLIDFLLAPETESRLAEMGYFLSDLSSIKQLSIDHAEQGPWFERSRADLSALLVR